MAIGLARMFGFHFPENFNYPYIAASITEFWRRWHMSLSRWFRDYLYIPLGGNRRSPARVYFNLILVFFLCGLWHGASWNFVIWGMFHGALLVSERVGLLKLLDQWPRPFRHGYTLLMVMVGWVFFRADTLPYALSYLGALAGRAPVSGAAVFPLKMFFNYELILIILLGLVFSTPLRPALRNLAERWNASLLGATRKSVFATSLAVAHICVLVGIFVYSLMLMAAGTYNPFIYFRF
jgi:alginate O-acetyltransferase complex protein AlgI